MEIKMSSKEFVDAISNGSNLEAEDAFKSAMSQRIGNALENKRKELSKDIDDVVESIKPANITKDGMKKLIQRIKDQQEEYGECSKKRLIKQLWGNGIKFAPYRRALMEHPNIRDKRSRISTYVWDTIEGWAKYDEELKKDENK